VDHYIYLLRLVDTESGQCVSLLSGPLCLPAETGWPRIRSRCLTLEGTIMSTYWDWLTQNQVKVSHSLSGPLYLPTETGWHRIRSRCLTLEWIIMSTCWLLFQWASTIKIQLSVLVKYNVVIISLIVTCSCNDIIVKLFICVEQQSLTHSITNANHWLIKYIMWCHAGKKRWIFQMY
jgi:hypothetical protein